MAHMNPTPFTFGHGLSLFKLEFGGQATYTKTYPKLPKVLSFN